MVTYAHSVSSRITCYMFLICSFPATSSSSNVSQLCERPWLVVFTVDTFRRNPFVLRTCGSGAGQRGVAGRRVAGRGLRLQRTGAPRVPGPAPKNSWFCGSRKSPTLSASWWVGLCVAASLWVLGRQGWTWQQTEDLPGTGMQACVLHEHTCAWRVLSRPL